MGLSSLPKSLHHKYEISEIHHATAILKEDFPNEYLDIVEILDSFILKKSMIVAKGKNKSPISKYIDSEFYSRGWKETNFDTKVKVDNVEYDSPTHKIDCYKNKIALEIEWNNKDPFYDRDLNNFRLLYSLGVISVGVIVTRCTELQKIFDSLGKGSSYGNSTTHLGKLQPRILGRGSGGCPVLIFGISKNLYDPSL